MTTGNAIALLGIAVVWLAYQLQAFAFRRRDISAARALLLGVEHGMGGDDGWGETFFGTVRDEQALKDRAQGDFDLIKQRTFGQVFLIVPTQPLASLLTSPAAGDLIRPETVKAANDALFHIGVFNQLVQMQTDFNSRHLPDIVDIHLASGRREALAHAAYKISYMLHASGVGTANEAGGWYRNLKDAVESNITDLDAKLSEPRWKNRRLALAVVFLIAAIGALCWAALSNHTENDRPGSRPHAEQTR